jgi:hypothetical protein
MPENRLQVLALRPGVNREGTSYAGEGGWYACDKVRFRSGLPEKLGGWVPYVSNTYVGICRHFAEWVSLSNFYLLAVGTNLKYYILTGGVFYNITPIRATFALGANPIYTMFSTLSAGINATATIIPVSGVAAGNMDMLAPFVVKIGSELIYVPAVDVGGNTLGTSGYPCTRGYAATTAVAHSSGANVSSSMIVLDNQFNGAQPGDFVTLSGVVGAVGGIPEDSLNAEMQVVTADNLYAILETGAQSTSAAQGGGTTIDAAYQIHIGSAFTQYLHGWGAGPWPGNPAGGFNHPWNFPYIGGFESVLRLWSASNYGQDLYFNLRNGPIYHWNAATSLSAYGSVTGPGVDITDPTEATITTDQIVNGNYYMLSYVGTTDFTLIGAASNTIGLGFTADLTTNPATGTGTVWDPATPSVATYVLTTDERHVVALGCNDAATAALAPVAATDFVEGYTYIINFVGTTDFTDVGATSNDLGVTFTATGSTTGTGTALYIEQDPMFVAWSAQEAPQVWYPTVTNTAGSYRLTYGSKIVTAEKTRQEILIWTDTALYSMQYLGAPYVYGFNPLSVDITIVSPNAMTTATGVTYWMGQDKFYAYSGRVDTLPCALRQYIFDDFNTDQWDQVCSGTNEKYNEIWWMYPSASSLVNDRYVIYNYLEKLWYYGQLSRTAWLDSHIIGNPLAAAALVDVSRLIAGSTYTISYVGDTDWVAVGAVAAIQGETFIATGSGTGTGVAIQSIGSVYEHEVGTDDGSINPPAAIAAYIESADFDLGDGGYQFSFVKRLIPDVDFIGSNVTNPSATMTLKARNYPGQGIAGTDPMQNAPAPLTGAQVSTQVYDYTNQVWVRLRGRQIIFRIESDSLGVKWQLGTPRLMIQPDGRR